jgi:hypothetical protein
MSEAGPIIGDRSAATTAALYATVSAGLIATCAPVIPASVRSFVVVVVGIGWLACLAACIVLGVRSYRSWLTDKVDVAFAAVGTVGIVIAVGALSQFALVRLISGREALFWHVDWRWALTHAHSIARSGGLELSIDYSGIPIMYHVGPAWFAGAFGHLTGAGTDPILVGVMPAASTIAAAIGLFSIVRSLRGSVPLALFAAGIALTFPALPNPVPWREHFYGIETDTWHFSAAQMTNSNFALGVVFASIALLVRRQPRRDIVIGTLGLASVLSLKPQYFMSTGAFGATRAPLCRSRSCCYVWFSHTHPGAF